MTSNFLLELLSEEIPARMQAKARNDLARMFAQELEQAGLSAGSIDVFSTPRRLALIACGIPADTAARSEEIKGPRTSAPPQALDGFLRKTGLAKEQLEERDGVYYARIEVAGQPTAAVLAQAIERIVRTFPWPKSMRWGAALASSASLRWVRPLQGIVALFGEEIVPARVDGIEAGATTVGHRFHHPGPITIGGVDDYAEKLRACHVIVDQEERERIIREGAEAAAADAGLTLLADEGLVVENAGLTEWPVPLLGRFDPEYLDVPREVIVLTMRTNQKYFALTGVDEALAPAFVCVANVDASDGGAAIVEGNKRVLASRLADARFFWEQDLKVPLEEQAKKLDGIIFHEKLGTVADKVERIAKLARWLVEEGIVSSPLPLAGGAGGGPVSPKLDRPSPNPSREREGDLADLAERAARLAKADLVTGMVGEFPELQGVIGGHLARAQGEPNAVADAVRDHYKPVGQGDDVPTAPVTVAVALADKLDTLSCFFAADLTPTGSKDPFALRRTALGIITLIMVNRIRLKLFEATAPIIVETVAEMEAGPIQRRIVDAAEALAALGATRSDAQFVYEQIRPQLDAIKPDARTKAHGAVLELLAFFADRLKVQQREAGIRHDLIDSVFNLGGEYDLVRLLARVKALQSFVETPDGTNLLTGYKRAANILKREKWTGPEIMSSPAEQGIAQTGEEDPLVLVEEPGLADAIAEMASGRAGADEPQEVTLIAALDAAEPAAEDAIEREDFTGAMAALARLRAPIDDFFDHVTVNDPDPAKREQRLNLLLRFRDAVHRVADFSKIEG